MKIILSLIGLLLCFNIQAQKVNKLIAEKKVTRIITTLAADDMRGRSALESEDIGKAAAFIEQEFKKTKLDFLPGHGSYLQEFQKDKVILQSINVIANGQPISPNQVLLMSDQSEIQLDQDTPIRNLKEGESIFQVYQALRRDSSDHIVLVPQSQEQYFRQLQGYFARPRILEKNASRPGSTLYILNSDSIQTVSVSASQKRESFNMANVAGIIEGMGKKDEYVIFSAHYDHIGIRPAVEGDSIANGADDDASGTTAVISLARYFKKLKSSERTLIFVAFTGEEIGGFGSRYFSEQLDPAKVMAMFNIEMIGKPSKWGTNSAFITGFEKSTFGEILQKNLAGTPFTIYPDPYPEQNLFYRSDNATLARQGVPAHSISTDQIPDDKLYHTVNDEVESLDMNNLTQTIRAIALSARSIVSGQDTPTRVDATSLR
jgi:hypothetical protein